jgi:hypothetical protein
MTELRSGGRRRAFAALAVTACGGSGSVAGDHIDGSIAGNQFGNVAASYWIGAPSAGSPPVILFVLETFLDCEAISSFNWDKTIGVSQVLELAVPALDVNTFEVPSEATVAYLRGDLNPDATSGHITVATYTAGVDLAADFDAGFGADSLHGAFDAQYCATGVEP